MVIQLRSYGLFFMLWLVVGSCAQQNNSSKIHFDLSQIDSEGLWGEADGKVAVDYEFCIPADPALQAEVMAIDTTVSLMKGSRGRIGCTEGQWLCVGSTHQPNYKKVLEKLAALDYVERIERTFYE